MHQKLGNVKWVWHPVVSPPMQMILGLSGLMLCETGELRHHIGQLHIRNVPWQFFSTVYLSRVSH